MRVHVGERALTTWLLLDTSASMTFGTADRRKADVAEGVALAIGHVASRRGNRLGVVPFGGEAPKVMRPRQGRLGLLQLLAELRAETEDEGPAPTSLGSALTASPRSPARAASRRGLRLPRRARLGGRPARAARAPRRAGRRDPRPARARADAVGRPLARRSRDRPPAPGQHEPAQRPAALRRGGAAEREDVAAALRRAGADHLVLSTGATGCATSRATCAARHPVPPEVRVR